MSDKFTTLKEVGFEGQFKIQLDNANLPTSYNPQKLLIPDSEDEQVFNQLSFIKDEINRFVSTGQNLLICSNYVGNGKTHWAISIAYSYLIHASNFSKSNPVMFINVPLFFYKKKMSMSNPSYVEEVNSIEDRIFKSDLVIFDDISGKGNSDFEQDSIYCWIESRLMDGKSSIYTSNARPEDMLNFLSPKIWDRIVGLSNVKILNGGTHRQR